MNYLQNIEDIYSKMYKSKEQAAAQKKQQTLADIQAQQTGVTNQYQELQNALKARKQATQAQYQGLYTNLNNQAEQGKEAYYNDRNNASLNNAQRVQQIRDYMAKNNLMSSGENVDAMLRQNTDLNNNLGRVYSEEQQFNRGIQDKRNSYLAQEQGAYGEIDNSLSAAQREQAQKIADLMNRMRLANEGYDSELMSYRDEIEAKKIADINAYNERLRQEQLAREAEERQYQNQLALQRTRSSSSSSSASQKAQKESDSNAVWNELYKQIDSRNAESFLQQNRDAIIANLGNTEYQKMLKYAKDYTYSASENKQYSQRMNNRTPAYYTE